MELDHAKKMQKRYEYVEALEEEQKKIQVFQRELPLCLELVTQAIETCRKELSSTSTTCGLSDCSEQTTSVCNGRVFEEFIPIKKNDQEEDGPIEEDDNNNNNIIIVNDNKKKSDWLRSVQLWNPSPEDSNPTEVFNSDRVLVVAKKAKVVEVSAFQPFQKRVLETAETQQPLVVKSATSSTTEKSGEKLPQTQTQSQTHRKQRRCWSPELHRRFLHALQQLGGSHVATPKQIRDHMKVDGLTNDEVKSHLQKYRLHTRRPATSVAAQSNGNLQQPQFMVVGGIWVPSQPSDVANNGGGVYASIAAQQPSPSLESPKCSVERSSGRCNSQLASSNTTTTSSPVS